MNSEEVAQKMRIIVENMEMVAENFDRIREVLEWMRKAQWRLRDGYELRESRETSSLRNLERTLTKLSNVLQEM